MVNTSTFVSGLSSSCVCILSLVLLSIALQIVDCLPHQRNSLSLEPREKILDDNKQQSVLIDDLYYKLPRHIRENAVRDDIVESIQEHLYDNEEFPEEEQISDGDILEEQRRSRAFRKKHKVARRFFTVPGHKCLIIDPNGLVRATRSKAKCIKYGTFCEINNGGKINLMTTRGNYIAINDSGRIYSEKTHTSDTNLTNTIADLFNFTVRIYRVVDNFKCYLNVSTQHSATFCSKKPFALQSRMVGTCK